MSIGLIGGSTMMAEKEGISKSALKK